MIGLLVNKEKFFAKNEKQFLEYLHKKNGITLTKDNLTLSFYDLEGNAYYKFPKELDLPMSRLSQLQSRMMWLAKGVSQDEYLKAIDVADKALTEGLGSKKGAAKIGFILEELKERCKMVVHDELFYNIIACQIIRHDESVTEFSNEIHMQKVEAFKAMDAVDDTFFLNIKEYLEVFGWWNITKIQFDDLMKSSRIVREAMEKMLKSL